MSSTKKMFPYSTLGQFKKRPDVLRYKYRNPSWYRRAERKSNRVYRAEGQLKYYLRNRRGEKVVPMTYLGRLQLRNNFGDY